jgi:hypothetical protein
MHVTAQMLRDLGAQNVIALKTPVSLINGVACTAKTLEYDSLEEVGLACWFEDHKVGGLIIIFEPDADIQVESEKVFVRLFSVTNDWSDTLPDEWKEDEYSALSMYRAKRDRAIHEIKQRLKKLEDLKLEIIAKNPTCGIPVTETTKKKGTCSPVAAPVPEECLKKEETDELKMLLKQLLERMGD